MTDRDKEFLAWAREKPIDETYPPNNYRKCAVGQFTGKSIHLAICGSVGLAENAYRAAAYEDPPTFGALVERLEALEEMV